MTRDEFVSDLIAQAKPIWPAYWGSLADDQRLRLSGMAAQIIADIAFQTQNGHRDQRCKQGLVRG